MPFIPHTEAETQSMLETIGAKTIDDLFDEIPAELKIPDLEGVPEGVSEMALAREMRGRALKDINFQCYIGAGAYAHHIPAAVWEVTTRGEFMTAYTPYQAEASQGTLQVIYEYQSMMASLTGMDISNASLYDGASGLAEAVLMAVRANRRSKSRKILIPTNVHPIYRKVVKTLVGEQGLIIEEIPFAESHGQFTLSSLEAYTGEDIAALVLPFPNFFGGLDDVDALTNWAHKQNTLVIGVVNPVAIGLLKEPGKWGKNGADIVCGDGQPLGVPMASGGPYYGFLCCKQGLVRQMPGRIVGRTVDQEGKQGFTLTLQAREQHIRRSKATSNICTNQGLAVTASTIHMSIVGPEGLKNVAIASAENTHYLVKRLTEIKGVEQVFDRPYFHEAVIRLPKPVGDVLNQLADANIQGGYDLSIEYPEMGNCLLVCVTEVKTHADMDAYHAALKNIIEG